MHKSPHYRLRATPAANGLVAVAVGVSTNRETPDQASSVTSWGTLGPMTAEQWRDLHAALGWGARLMGGEVIADDRALHRLADWG